MKKIGQLVMLLVCPLLTQAHGYWFELEQSENAAIGEPVQIHLYYGEYASQIREVGSRLDKMVDIKVTVISPDGEELEVNMTQTNTRWEGSYTPNSEGYYQVLGLNDTREVQDWHKHKLGITRPIQYLRTGFSVGENQSAADQLLYLDTFCKINANNVELYAMKDGKPMNKTKIRVVNPEGWLQDKFSNQIGFVSVVPNKKGLYLAEVEWIEEVPGTFKGKAYETIRHKCDMTFVIN